MTVTTHSWVSHPSGRRVEFADPSRFTSCDWLERAGGEYQERTGDEEGCLIVLSGCHDLYAGGGSWIERGVRNAPHSGRPVVVFLPPSTPFKLERGHGAVLRLGCRRPPPQQDPGEAAGGQHKPLLAMAGSGKAFDSATGEWKPQEQMPDSPEALLPRRIERTVDPNGRVWEAVLPLDYKASALVVDEIVVPQGQSIELGQSTGSRDPGTEPPWADEALVIQVTEGEGADPIVTTLDPRSDSLRVESRNGSTWVLWARAGRKPV